MIALLSGPLRNKVAIFLACWTFAAMACASPTASPPPSQPAATSGTSAQEPWQAELDRTIEAARKEGILTINIQPGTYHDWVNEFGKKYPFLKLETAQLFGEQFVARSLAEQGAGQYLWDIHLGGPNSAYRNLIPVNALDPLAPALFLPEVLDDSKWLGGFSAGWADQDGKYVYTMQGEVSHEVAVNRDFVPEAQLRTIQELTDPKWAGKVSVYDPRIPGAGAASGAHFILIDGPDWWRQFLATQPVITQDRRQQTEWLVRGQYPITVAPSTDVIQEFKKQGIGQSIVYLAPDTPAGHRLLLSFSVMQIAKAPHPNAAKLFLNWALSREGQDLLQKDANTASRRLDIPDAPGMERAKAGVDYAPPVNKQVNEQYVTQAIDIAKDVLR